ncbi:FAD-binding oxidoreductase [soil metagenome]
MTDVVAALAEALGADCVLSGEAVPRRNWSDWSGAPAVRPRAVALPRDVAGVAAALRICHAGGQAVVVQGGLTGLAAGATPGEGEIALSLERLSGIEAVDAASATMTVSAGTTLQAAQEAAGRAGFALGIDIGARGSCTIGGNIATNAGGLTVVQYGMMRAQVRGLEVVLADGTVVSTLNRLPKNNAGYDWTQLFIGSEGTLGVVTRAVLALHPLRACTRTAFCAAPDFGAALAALRQVQRALPGELMAFEAMWPDYIAYAGEAGFPPPLDPAGGVALIVEAARGAAETQAEAGDPFEAVLMALIEDGTLAGAVLAQSFAERRRIWAVRDEAPATFEARLPACLNFDIGLPQDSIAPVVAEMRAALQARWPGIRALFFGHVADGNLHIVAQVPGAAEQPKAEIEAEVYRRVGPAGGSVSAEHGIGRIKKPYLSISRSHEEIALMARLKAALDPAGILNPGRIF